jgi:enoyl-CoA hydratase/carnithine racemase
MSLSISKEDRRYGSIAYVEINGLEPNNTLVKADLNEFIETMNDLSREVDGMIVTSGNDKFFSNGLDGATLLNLSREERRETVVNMIRFYPQLFEIPKPWIAEIAGHAMAGGAVMATGADNRYMLAKSGRLGFSEMLVGMPLPAVYIMGVQKLVHPKYLREIMYGGAYKPEEALEIGLIDGIAQDKESLRKMSVKQMDGLLRLNRQAFLMTRNLNRGAIQQDMQRVLEKDVEAGGNAALSEEFDSVLNNIAKRNR